MKVIEKGLILAEEQMVEDLKQSYLYKTKRNKDNLILEVL